MDLVKRRVVVTGLGLVTPIGNSVEATWAGLMAGRSGVDYIKKFDASDFPVRIAAEVKDFDPLDYVEKKEARKMGSFIHYAIAASDEALRDSGLRITPEIAERVGTYISSGIGDFWAIEREHSKLLKEGPGRVSPFFIPSAIVNLAAGQVSIRTGAKGPNSATATACSAGAHAIGDSFKIIQRGDADVMICGGAESAITPMSVAGFAAMRALSTRNDDPPRASRPFDAERDGFVIGEGAGIMILEELEFARRRGARIYAEIAGYGMTADAYHITQPDETASGAVRVMQMAMRDAGVRPEQVGYINAHGTSTPYNDRLETLAIKKAFGEHAYRLAVSSTKSMTGHLLGAAGGIEAVFSVLAIARKMIPPTINYTTPDPDCDLDYVPNEPREAQIECALSNSFGFGGTNAALLFRRYEEE
ncbi:beta-ketoacyl-ACP synthase II [Pyrinomonas methylaliphatogenes]|uniref:3-oxoacyl-[acyl-carrier-protein] synthase 2 n=1 Tax=Pyrinomonas methylaliphatogenes TaxID=454194 RepID=A0A0B6X155_9BACT|nr:beta-ketoacyl-ACP synthase II [Pyrinomonas methylaliphatogenes]MBX5478604.1 beta-ketoacyl-ACP synthase II [Pyrinomonas methylaliphatogenes]CDM66085.1 3-oxoacyl-(acyl-carrier-protein) synthase II [Pyrinomonas methylaliphatogenes]